MDSRHSSVGQTLLPPSIQAEFPIEVYLPTRSLSPDPNAPPTHHFKYYFEDELSIFQVQRKLYKVHRHFFTRDSECFSSMFALPSGESKTVEGQTDESPIVLPDVTTAEFDCLLSFFYDGMYHSNNDLVPKALFRAEDWKLLLSICTRFQFLDARTRSIKELDVIGFTDPIEQLELAQKYDVTEWFTPAYIAICKRRNALTLAEAGRIGYSTAILLAEAREEVRTTHCAGGHNNQNYGNAFSGQSWNNRQISDHNVVYNPLSVERIVNRIFPSRK